MGAGADVQVSPAELEQVQGLFMIAACMHRPMLSRKKSAPCTNGKALRRRYLREGLQEMWETSASGTRLHIQVYRGDRRSHEAAYFYAWRKMSRHGPLAGWYFLR